MDKNILKNHQFPFSRRLSRKKSSCLIPIAIVFSTLQIACDTQQLPLDAQLSISPKNRSIDIVDGSDDQRGNGNGVIDNDLELVSGRGDSIARVRTNALSGYCVLLLRINMSCPFRGEVFAFVDGVTASADIQVNAVVEEQS